MISDALHNFSDNIAMRLSKIYFWIEASRDSCCNETHIEVEDMAVNKTAEIQKLIEHELHERYEINHTTLQFECRVCENTSMI